MILAPRTVFVLASKPSSSSLLRSCSKRGLATLSRPFFPSEIQQQIADQDPYWQKIPQWRKASAADFLSHKWQMDNTIQTQAQLVTFMQSILPPTISPVPSGSSHASPCISQDQFLEDINDGVRQAPMSIRLSPHILSLIDWQRPLSDPLLRQFIPLGSRLLPDHPELSLDSLDETADSPVPGLIHRYPDKAVFLATSVCPVYCRFCTRSYSTGVDTASVAKVRFLPIMKKWEPIFAYVARTAALADIVVSGGDSYSLSDAQLLAIGRRLLALPHILRVRFASKGLAVCPSRLLDPADTWTAALIQLSDEGRALGKSVSLHTHFNHPNEITWVTEAAAQRLFRAGVQVRNQTVLLNGVNSDVETMTKLIRRLAALNIQPYYVLQHDLVRGVEDLRTPLSTILALEAQIRGTIAGFMTPNFVVTLPGGGGKRLACSFESYDRATGRSRFRARNSHMRNEEKMGAREEVWEYWDPLWSLEEGERGVGEIRRDGSSGVDR